MVDELEEPTQSKLVQSRGEGKLPVPLRGCQSNQKKKNKGVNAGPPNNKTSTLLNTREAKKGRKEDMNTMKIFGEGLIKSFISNSIPYGFVWDENLQGDYISVVSYGDYEVGDKTPY